MNVMSKCSLSSILSRMDDMHCGYYYIETVIHIYLVKKLDRWVYETMAVIRLKSNYLWSYIILPERTIGALKSNPIGEKA